MSVTFTEHEIESAILAAAPAEGERWQAKPIAMSLAALAQAKVLEQEDTDRIAKWRAGLDRLESRFVPSGIQPGNAGAVIAMQDLAQSRHDEAAAEKLRQNKALIAVVGAGVVTAITGGGGLAVMLPVLIGEASKVRDYMNTSDAEPMPTG